MKLALRSSDATKPVVKLHVYDGSSKQAERAWIRTGGTLKQFMGAFSVAVSDNEPAGHGYAKGIISVTTTPVSITVTGAIGTVTYAWTRTDGGGHSWTINNPSGSSTTFTTTVSATVPQSATFQCVITDSAGQTSTVSVSATCSNDYFGGGFS